MDDNSLEYLTEEDVLTRALDIIKSNKNFIVIDHRGPHIPPQLFSHGLDKDEIRCALIFCGMNFAIENLHEFGKVCDFITDIMQRITNELRGENTNVAH